MTSEQVMLAAAALLIGGCAMFRPAHEPPKLASPFQQRHVWAVLPLVNDSGSLNADGLVMADQLARHLENAPYMDVLPVNRVLAAMDAAGMEALNSPSDALALLRALNADGLVVGSITSYDPYDPPKIGLTLELYARQRTPHRSPLDLRSLSGAAVAGQAGNLPSSTTRQPVATTGGFFDSADPETRDALTYYANDRGPEPNEHAPRIYRINIDLFSEFVCFVMSGRLLHAESQRLAATNRLSQATDR